MATEQTTADLALTPKAIEALEARPESYEVADPNTPGLRLRVESSGSKAFRWYVTGAKPRRVVTIGKWAMKPRQGHVTLAQAREWLERLKDAHRAGALDEQLDELDKALGRRRRGAIARGTGPATFAEVCEDFYRRRIVPHRKRPKVVRDLLDKDILPVIGPRLVTALTTRECARVVEKVVDRDAPVHAGKVLQVLKQACRYAEARGYTDRNPAGPLEAKDLGVETNVTKRWLTADEIVQFWKALDRIDDAPEAAPGKKACSVEGCGGAFFAKGLCSRHYRRLERHGSVSDPKDPSSTTRAALRLLLLTGVRTGELLQAKWTELDFDDTLPGGQEKPEADRRPTWTIPVEAQKLSKDAAKKAKPFVIPLSPTAVELFTELQAAAGRSKWVMASASSTGHFADKALGRAMRRLFAGTPPRLVLEGGPASPHDLRRTARTHLGKLRVPLHVVERCLNHSLGRIVETYDQGDYIDERRDALARWDAYLLGLVSGNPKIVPLVVAGGRP